MIISHPTIDLTDYFNHKKIGKAGNSESYYLAKQAFELKLFDSFSFSITKEFKLSTFTDAIKRFNNKEGTMKKFTVRKNEDKTQYKVLRIE